jgi:hypothetical protein
MVRVASEVFNLFGDASGLRVNYNKRSATLICCIDSVVEKLNTFLLCISVPFPCTYLGLLLSISCLTKTQLQSYMKKLAKQLPTWNGNLLDV